MKRWMIAAALLLLAGMPLPAQEPGMDAEPERFGRTNPDSTDRYGFDLPDSLAYLSPWRPRTPAPFPDGMKPAVTMTSLVMVPMNRQPQRVTVTKDNVLHLGEYFSISNGQAWNWGPYPNSFLDARTLSFPAPM